MNVISTSNMLELSLKTTRKIFFIAGFCLACWAPFIPIVKERLQVGDGTMGALLLVFGTGSLLMIPCSGLLAARYGCRIVFSTSLLLALLIFPALMMLNQVGFLFIALFLFGAGIGAMDVVANIHAVLTQKHAGEPVMSGFHAFFSMGGIAGAGMVSALLALGTDIIHILAAAITILCVLIITAWGGFLDERHNNNSPFLVRPKGSVIIIGGLCCIAYVMEGSILDWGGIFLTHKQLIDLDFAGMGYTLFAVTMTTGRLIGDKSITLLGVKNVFLISALLSSAGFVLLTTSTIISLTVTSFLLIGLGVSNLAPILFTASGQQKDMPDYLAVAAVSTLGYSGILMGPALLGGISHISSITISFTFVSILATLLFFYALKNKIN